MNTAISDGAWIGHWLLLPELSHYGDGKSPERATYDIAAIGDGSLQFNVAWWNDGQKTSIAFEGIPDGEQRPTDSPGVTHMTVTSHSRLRLDSAAWAGDKMVARATRRVSEDGRLMSIVQELFPESRADPVTVFQVYMRRID